MTEEHAFIEWKSEQYKHQDTEEEMEFVEHLHYFPRHFKKTFLAGYHECQKEHEWHYVKNGDLPKEYEDLWICFNTEDDMKDYVRGWYEYDFDNDKHIFKYINEIGTQYLKNVYAWQTLVPPKESE